MRVFLYFLFAGLRLRRSSFLGGRFDPTEESIFHSVLGETEGVGIDKDKVEILGSLVRQRVCLSVK